MWGGVEMVGLHGDDFVYGNLAAAGQDGAAFGLFGCVGKRVGFDDGVAGGKRSYGAVADFAVAGDAFGCGCKWSATVYEGAAESAHPGSPGVHDCCLFGFAFGYAAAAGIE